MRDGMSSINHIPHTTKPSYSFYALYSSITQLLYLETMDVNTINVIPSITKMFTFIGLLLMQLFEHSMVHILWSHLSQRDQVLPPVVRLMTSIKHISPWVESDEKEKPPCIMGYYSAGISVYRCTPTKCLMDIISSGNQIVVHWHFGLHDKMGTPKVPHCIGPRSTNGNTGAVGHLI